MVPGGAPGRRSLRTRPSELFAWTSAASPTLTPRASACWSGWRNAPGGAVQAQEAEERQTGNTLKAPAGPGPMAPAGPQAEALQPRHDRLGGEGSTPTEAYFGGLTFRRVGGDRLQIFLALRDSNGTV